MQNISVRLILKQPFLTHISILHNFFNTEYICTLISTTSISERRCHRHQIQILQVATKADSNGKRKSNCEANYIRRQKAKREHVPQIRGSKRPIRKKKWNLEREVNNLFVLVFINVVETTLYNPSPIECL